MKADDFKCIIPKVNNVYFSPSFLMRGEKVLKFVTDTGDVVSRDASLRLYRTMRVSNVLEIVNSKTLRFDVPLRWTDPFEKLFYKNPVKCGSKDYYVACLCFSYNSVDGEESMWNVHAPSLYPPYEHDKCSVRACFDMFSLCKNLANANPDFEFYIAPADYSKSRKEILQTYQKRKGNYASIYEFIGDMILKRKAFSYEKEIRMFIVSSRPFKKSNDFILIPLNKNRSGIITSLTLPPILPISDPYNAKAYQQDLESKANPVKSYLRNGGFDKKIYISRLYDIL